jgi:pimeloyl-ACP methyl ester carboxylesterase
VFELGEDLFDQVQVRGVFRQEERALPLLLTHGWSGSFLEFSKVIGPLTDPVAHGGKASDAFHVIVPSLPGFGFSDKPQSTGWPLTRTAKAWAELMKRLGYNRYVAQGGDLGAGVTTHMGRLKPKGLAAIHLNFPTLFPPPIEGEPDAKEKAALGQLMRFRDKESGYSQIQKTRPQTLGYGLTDSPIGQAAWIYEKCIELAGDGISLRGRVETGGRNSPMCRHHDAVGPLSASLHRIDFGRPAAIVRKQPESGPHAGAQRHLGADLEIPVFLGKRFLGRQNARYVFMLNNTSLRSEGIRLATIDNTPSRTLNGLRPSGTIPRPS